MFSCIQKFQEASRETKLFVVTNIILAVIVLGTLVYAFARLDSVRSYDNSSKQTEETLSE